MPGVADVEFAATAARSNEVAVRRRRIEFTDELTPDERKVRGLYDAVVVWVWRGVQRQVPAIVRSLVVQASLARVPREKGQRRKVGGQRDERVRKKHTVEDGPCVWLTADELLDGERLEGVKI